VLEMRRADKAEIYLVLWRLSISLTLPDPWESGILLVQSIMSGNNSSN